MGPESPQKVGCIGWGQITKGREGSKHGGLENGLYSYRCHASGLKGGWQDGPEGAEPGGRDAQ